MGDHGVTDLRDITHALDLRMIVMRVDVSDALDDLVCLHSDLESDIMNGRNCSGASPLRAIRRRIARPHGLCRGSILARGSRIVGGWAFSPFSPPTITRRPPHRVAAGPPYGR